MVLEDYQLSTLRDRIREDFGLTESTTMNSIIDKKINDAQAWVVRRRKNWPWQEVFHNIDVPAAVSDTGDFTQGSRTVGSVPGSSIAARDIITTDVSASTNPTAGFLVQAYSDPNVTLFSQFLNTTEVGKSFRIVKGFFLLPEDFQSLEMATLEGDLEDPKMTWKTPDQIQRLKQEEVIISIKEKVYSVVQDPLSGTAAETNRRYLEVYPYLAQLTTLRLKYWRVPPKLVNDSDVPIIPHSDRMVLFYAAAWFFAQQQHETEPATFYRNLALTEIEKMAQEYSFADDPDDGERDTGLNFDFIPGPPEYPKFSD